MGILIEVEPSGTQMNQAALSYSCTRIQGQPIKMSELLRERGFSDDAIKLDISAEGLNAYKQMFCQPVQGIWVKQAQSSGFITPFRTIGKRTK